MSIRAIKVNNNEPIVLDLVRMIGEAIPGASYKEIHGAAISVVLNLRRDGVIGRYEPPAKTADNSEPEQNFWDVEGYAE